MKVGIITLFYKTYNFGATLQSYALQKAIEDMGYECEQIRYLWYNEFTKLIYENTPGMNVPAFEHFHRSIPHSRYIYTPDTIVRANAEYDTFVCGSDQIWGAISQSPLHNLPLMLLSFAGSSKGKIAYAASCGAAIPEGRHRDVIRIFSADLDSISMREKIAAEGLGKIINRKVTYVLDPTMLLDAKRWAELDTMQTNEKFILLYLLGKNPELQDAAEALSRKTGLPVIKIPGPDGLKIGPAEFVHYIRNAEYIITNSFHGTVFSIIFHKQCAVFPISTDYSVKSKNVRLTNLLETVKISERFAADIDTDAVVSLIERPIDYEKIDAIIKSEREKSLAFLKGSLEAADKKTKLSHKTYSSTAAKKDGEDYLNALSKECTEEELAAELRMIDEYEVREGNIRKAASIIKRRITLDRLENETEKKRVLDFCKFCGNDIYIYGAGYIGKKISEMYNNIKGFIDMYTNEKKIMGLSVYRPEYDILKEICGGKKITIIVTLVSGYEKVLSYMQCMLPDCEFVSLEDILNDCI